MHTQMQTGAEIPLTEREPQVEYSREGQQHCESSPRVRVVKRSRAEKRFLSCGDDDGRGIAPPSSLGILGNAGQAPIADRFNGSTRHHPTTGILSSQAYRNKTLVASSET